MQSCNKSPKLCQLITICQGKASVLVVLVAFVHFKNSIVQVNIYVFLAGKWPNETTQVNLPPHLVGTL